MKMGRIFSDDGSEGQDGIASETCGLAIVLAWVGKGDEAFPVAEASLESHGLDLTRLFLRFTQRRFAILRVEESVELGPAGPFKMLGATLRPSVSWKDDAT